MKGKYTIKWHFALLNHILIHLCYDNYKIVKTKSSNYSTRQLFVWFLMQSVYLFFFGFDIIFFYLPCIKKNAL